MVAEWSRSKLGSIVEAGQLHGFGARIVLKNPHRIERASVALKYLRTISAICAFVLLGACATRPANLTPKVDVAGTAFSGGFDVAVSGSKESMAKNADIEFAVRSAITEAELFSGDTANFYDVGVQILAIETPLIAADLTSKVRAKWTLHRRGDSDATWTESISSSKTAKFGENVIAAQRLRLANERAISANVELGIKWLAKIANSISEE
jgi:hypothetical protein